MATFVFVINFGFAGKKARKRATSERQPVEPEAQFRFSRNGPKKPIILTGGFAFEKEREFPNGRTRWRCTKGGNCRANIYTIDSDVVLFNDKHDHT